MVLNNFRNDYGHRKALYNRFHDNRTSKKISWFFLKIDPCRIHVSVMKSILNRWLAQFQPSFYDVLARNLLIWSLRNFNHHFMMFSRRNRLIWSLRNFNHHFMMFSRRNRLIRMQYDAKLRSKPPKKIWKIRAPKIGRTHHRRHFQINSASHTHLNRRIRRNCVFLTNYKQ